MDSNKETIFLKGWLTLTLVLSLCVAVFASADSQRIVDYQYDGAGNITGVRTGRNLGPPDVTALAPAFVNKDNIVSMTATGVNLYQVSVTTNAAGVSVFDVVNISETEVRLSLSANNNAVIGPALLSFTTRLGQDTETITVAERTPVISTVPNPIVLSPDGTSINVELIFDSPFTTDQVYDLAVRDTDIASVSQQTATLFAGETKVSVSVAGLVTGNTFLEINQLSNFLALGIQLRVTEDQLPAGTHLAYSEPLGVTISLTPPAVTTTGTFATPEPLGVAISLTPPAFTGTGIFATQQPTGVAYGTVVSLFTPTAIARGNTATLIISGEELDAVTELNFLLDNTGIQIGTLSATPDGSQLSVPLTIDPSAPVGNRFISLSTPSGQVLVSPPLFIQ